MTNWNEITVKVLITNDDDSIAWNKVLDGIRDALKYSDSKVLIDTKETLNG